MPVYFFPPNGVQKLVSLGKSITDFSAEGADDKEGKDKEGLEEDNNHEKLDEEMGKSGQLMRCFYAPFLQPFSDALIHSFIRPFIQPFTRSLGDSLIHSNPLEIIQHRSNSFKLIHSSNWWPLLGGTHGEDEGWHRPGLVQPPDRQGSRKGSRHAQPNQTGYLPSPHSAPPGTLGTSEPPAGLIYSSRS